MKINNDTVIGDISTEYGNIYVTLEEYESQYKQHHIEYLAKVFVHSQYAEEIKERFPDKIIEIGEIVLQKIKQDSWWKGRLSTR